MQYLIYLLIIVVKTFEVTMATLRIKLITKGEQLQGAIVGFFEVIIWVLLVSTVLKDITSDPLKVLAYAIGFGLGNFYGIAVENRLGLGTMRVEVIVKSEDGERLAKALRALGYAVTVTEGKGMNFNRNILIIITRRKKTGELVNAIKNIEDNSFITITDTKPIYGGYGTIKK